MSLCSNGYARLAAKGRRNWLRSFGPRVEDVWKGGLLVGRSAHWMSTLLYARMVTQSKRWSFGGCVWMRHDAMQQAATRSYLVFPPVNAG
jgi:hypothetical protein